MKLSDYAEALNYAANELDDRYRSALDRGSLMATDLDRYVDCLIRLADAAERISERETNRPADAILLETLEGVAKIGGNVDVRA